jgi:hypothetical protein
MFFQMENYFERSFEWRYFERTLFNQTTSSHLKCFIIENDNMYWLFIYYTVEAA